MTFAKRWIIAACALIAAMCTPSIAACQTTSNANIWITLVNNTTLPVTVSNLTWSGRYGTERDDGTIVDRIADTVAPGKGSSGRLRMNYAGHGRYTELEFDASFTTDDKNTKTCHFWLSFLSETGEKSRAVSSRYAGNPYPKCSITQTAYYNWSLTVEPGEETNQ
jgi:hypothetical protein